MPITNAVITDYIPAGQLYVSDSASIDNSAPADGFKYTPVSDDSGKTGMLTYTFPTGSSNTINNTYTITFKTKITDLSIFNTNGTKTLSNTASITGDEIPTDGNRSSTGTQAVNNTVINKTPSYVYGNSYIDWTLNVNSNFNIYMSNATITDELQEGLSLNTDTVQLYEATVNTNGTLTAGAKVPLTGVNVKYDPTTRKFDFTFPENAGFKSYILKFTTDVSKTGNYSNTVEFKSTDTDQTSSTNQNGVWYASGSAWGTGVSGSITVSKVDANDTTRKLSGAVFQLIDQYGNVKATSAPTGSDGTALFKALKYDVNYTLKEITPPTGYTLSDEAYTFQVHDTTGQRDITYSFKDTKIKGNIQFSKNGEDGKGLSGAEFTLYQNDGITPVLNSDGKNTTAVSDKDGKVEFTNIDYGTYKIKETKSPNGYTLSTDTLTATFSGDYQNTVVTVNPNSITNIKIRGGIKITKLDTSTSSPVPGATITVYNSDGTPVGTGVEGITATDGTVEFDNLAYGDYYFLETKAPEGYLLNTDKHPFSIKDNGVVLKDTLSDTRVTGGIKITKTDTATSKPVPGATVTVYTSDGKAVGSGLEGITGLDGTVKFDNLSYGDYYFVETNAPRGYLLNTDKHSFSIKENGVTITSSFSDEKVKGTVLVEKKGEDGNYLGDTEFTLYDVSGKAVQSSITDSDGTARFTGVEYGKYAVRETRAPKGYNISDKLISVEVNGTESGKNYDAGDITDTKIRGSIQVKKLDQDGKPLKGAEFTVYDESGKAIQTALSMEDGIVLFKDLVYGKYSIKETKVPEGYTALNNVIEASIEQNGYTYSYEVKNNRIKGTVDIKKTDINGNALQGAEFTIYDNGGNAIATKVSDSNGLARFETLDYGNYTIKETKAPQGYNVSDKVVSVNVDGTGKGGTYDAGVIADTKVTGNVQIKKLSEDGKTLKDAEFTLYDLNGKAVKSVVTEENGTAIFTDVEYGKYTIKETKAPKGYNISDKEIMVEVNGTESGKSYDAGTVTDTKIKGSIKINKIDQDGKPLKGAEFTLYDESGKALQTAVSMEDGIVLFKDLVYGKYSVKETKVPEGYIVSSNAIETSVESNGYTYSYEVKNSRIKGTIEIKKTDLSGNALQGAEFTLYDNNGKVISTQVSGSNGVARFEAVDYGTYTIRETKAPKGYTVNSTIQKVQVSSSNTQSFTIKDEREVQVLPTTGSVVDDTFMIIIALLSILVGISLKLSKKANISKKY
ncbi:SpaA isopeptide-forming pilin-related protein [Clostridium manihotivorum]|uniref:Cna protein B-type domain-containing protein n=1 Tax=Clostridium manihotivorum TaxID=2320868 RepID=A0A410DN49_9CLOT|nr:SpaA isopeptide-forming pilin-related protein [Clostridium manihotivorum]QAA30490.1 hypothetical protein C1I91_01740 [Clostridium manihotivorum]